ncbi:uncharacterized protein LOC129971946 isoform X1 [Argiope bruennichi]|uniref:uncharacterized protein LOC129971946 isoform X1 n=1 Tax=Argiope bruennichi TaxID=94029 RepID=UPI002494A7ED|nr:uncharacterized protein LOC129971946 isoform X1 [Argiope bruennichi]
MRSPFSDLSVRSDSYFELNHLLIRMSGNSESEKERKCKRSACWLFYDKTPGGGFCRVCHKEILTQAGGTTNLRNHLRRKHGELWTATMENRLDPSTLTINDRRYAGHIVTETVGNEITLNIVKAPQEPAQDKPVDFSFITNADGAAPSEEETSEHVPEPSTAVHTIQAYRDVNGTTFLYLQPATDGETSVQIQNAQFQPVVASSESITTNGEIVSVAIQKEPSAPEVQAADSEAQTQEEATPRRVVHAPVKNYQGSSAPARAAVRQAHRPSPVKTSPASNSYNNNYNSYKEDSYEAFGKYIASMLRNLPAKSACKLQGEIVNWILKEQIKNNS